MTDNEHDLEALDDKQRAEKIRSLRDMVMNAERTLQGAKTMLLQLEGKKKTGRPRKAEIEEGEVVQGTFDGQIMLGSDGKQYPVPANYASKSKLVEGDLLKLTILENGMFLYKQIGPVERKHAIGIVTQDEAGNYFVVAEHRPYRVLLASITYFKATPGDEVAIVLPLEIDSQWAAIENILQKGSEIDWQNIHSQAAESSSVINDWKKDLPSDTETEDTEATSSRKIRFHEKNEEDLKPDSNLLASWIKDLEEIESELEKETTS